jgi:hydrogenase nickel incorporation protein HypA/HybF
MHELSIALSIVDGTLDELQRHGESQALAVHIRVGRLSGIDREALLFSYGIAAQETALANSRLIIEDVDIKVFCPSCGGERTCLTFPILTCADCGGLAQRVVHGGELEITGIELSDEPTAHSPSSSQNP